MSASITGTVPSYAFVNLAIGLSFFGIDFDHDEQMGLDVTGLPPGVESQNVLGSRQTGSFTVDTGTDLLTFAADHHLQEGDIVTPTSTGTLPAPLVEGDPYYVIASGLTNDDLKLSATLGGAAVNLTTAGSGTHRLNWTAVGNHFSRLDITGAPEEPGIYDITIAAVGSFGGSPAQVLYTTTLVVEGGDTLAWFDLDHTTDPPEPRHAIGLQYNMRTRTFSSSAFAVVDGLELFLGQGQRIYAILSRNGSRTLSDLTPLLPDPAPSNVSLIIRPENNYDAPPFLRLAAAGTEAIGIGAGPTRDVNYFDVSITSARLRRLFRQLNAGETGDPSSAYLLGSAELRFDLDGKTHFTPPLKVKVRQPFNR